MTLESKFQRGLIKTLHNLFPGALVLKNDPNYIQGIPDLIILYGDRWAALEVKQSKNAPYRPNQEYYLDKMNSMSYSATIYPENAEEVLYDLQRSFSACR